MSRCKIYFLLLSTNIFFTFCVCQSGDFYLFPANVSESVQQHEPDSKQILFKQESTNHSKDFYQESGNGMQVEENLNFDNVARFPLESPPCLPLNKWASSVLLQYGTRRVLFDERKVLTEGDLRSEKVQISGILAAEKYMETKESTYLELNKFLGGCKQEIAGELLFLIFNATETISCQKSNCTRPVIANKECRARVHVSSFAPWKPYFVSCHSPEYFQLPWRRINV